MDSGSTRPHMGGTAMVVAFGVVVAAAGLVGCSGDDEDGSSGSGSGGASGSAGIGGVGASGGTGGTAGSAGSVATPECLDAVTPGADHTFQGTGMADSPSLVFDGKTIWYAYGDDAANSVFVRRFACDGTEIMGDVPIGSANQARLPRAALSGDQILITHSVESGPSDMAYQRIALDEQLLDASSVALAAKNVLASAARPSGGWRLSWVANGGSALADLSLSGELSAPEVVTPQSFIPALTIDADGTSWWALRTPNDQQLAFKSQPLGGSVEDELSVEVGIDPVGIAAAGGGVWGLVGLPDNTASLLRLDAPGESVSLPLSAATGEVAAGDNYIGVLYGVGSGAEAELYFVRINVGTGVPTVDEDIVSLGTHQRLADRAVAWINDATYVVTYSDGSSLEHLRFITY